MNVKYWKIASKLFFHEQCSFYTVLYLIPTHNFTKLLRHSNNKKSVPGSNGRAHCPYSLHCFTHYPSHNVKVRTFNVVVTCCVERLICVISRRVGLSTKRTIDRYRGNTHSVCTKGRNLNTSLQTLILHDLQSEKRGYRNISKINQL